MCEEISWEKTGIIKIHIFKFYYRAFMEYPEIRDEFIKKRTIAEFKETVKQITELRKDKSNADKLGW